MAGRIPGIKHSNVCGCCSVDRDVTLAASVAHSRCLREPPIDTSQVPSIKQYKSRMAVWCHCRAHRSVSHAYVCCSSLLAVHAPNTHTRRVHQSNQSDNACDPDVNAASFYIDVFAAEDSSPLLSFQDDGCGASPETLHRMLSFGFCEKVLEHAPARTLGSPGAGADSDWYSNGWIDGNDRWQWEIVSLSASTAMASSRARCDSGAMRSSSPSSATPAASASYHRPSSRRYRPPMFSSPCTPGMQAMVCDGLFDCSINRSIVRRSLLQCCNSMSCC